MENTLNIKVTANNRHLNSSTNTPTQSPFSDEDQSPRTVGKREKKRTRRPLIIPLLILPCLFSSSPLFSSLLLSTLFSPPPPFIQSSSSPAPRPQPPPSRSLLQARHLAKSPILSPPLFTIKSFIHRFAVGEAIPVAVFAALEYRPLLLFIPRYSLQLLSFFQSEKPSLLSSWWVG